MSNIPKKPSDEIIEHIKSNYTCNPITGIISNIEGKEIVGMMHNNGKRITKRIRIKGKDYKYHHVCWLLYKGKWPKEQLDHEDRDQFNDRENNLRYVSDKIQQRNKDNYTGHRGFSIYRDDNDKFRNKIWRVRNQRQGIELGRHETVEDAIEFIDRYLDSRGKNEA